MIISKTPLRISFFGGGTDFPEWFMKNNGLFSGHTDLKLNEVLAKLQLVAETPFENAIPIPAAVNHSQEFFNHE